MTPRKRIAITLMAVTVMADASALLRRYPPAQYGFYPTCPIHTYLHLLCPGCGATRSLAALLRGHLQEAWHWNALFVLTLPCFAGYSMLCGYRLWRRERFHWPEVSHTLTYTALGVALLFTIARNLSF